MVDQQEVAAWDAVFANNLAAFSATLNDESDIRRSLRAKVDGRTMLMTAAGLGHLPMLRVLIDRGADLEAESDYVGDAGMTPLMFAAQSGELACLQVLINAGADVTATANDGRTMLMCAVESGELACVRAFLAASNDGSDF